MKISLRRVISAAMVAAVTTTMAFSQTVEELMQKAKNYEAEKKWISAAGTYYDVMEASPDDTGVEAYNALVKIFDNIKNGNPGNDTYDDFTKVDGWTDLLKDAEAYFTHNSAIYITAVYSKGDLDMKTRTCKYNFSVCGVPNTKFNTLSYAMRKGAEKVTSCPMPEDWPSTSIYKTSSGTGDAAISKMTLPVPPDGNSLFAYGTLKKYLETYNDSEMKRTYFTPDFAMGFYYLPNANASEQNSLYEAVFEIVDENGNVLGTSGKKRIPFYSRVKDHDCGGFVTIEKQLGAFSLNLDSKGMSAIDSEKFSIRVKSFVLKDTNLTGSFVKNGGNGKLAVFAEKVFSDIPVANTKVLTRKLVFDEVYHTSISDRDYLIDEYKKIGDRLQTPMEVVEKYIKNKGQ